MIQQRLSMARALFLIFLPLVPAGVGMAEPAKVPLPAASVQGNPPATVTPTVTPGAPRPEVVKFKMDLTERFAELLSLGFAQAKIDHAPDFNISKEGLVTPYSQLRVKMVMVKHTASELATAMAKFAERDWRNKAAEGLAETRVLYWVDSQSRQHAAAINVEWWLGEQAQYRESYIRLSLDQLWLGDGKGGVKAYPISAVSREVIFSHPAELSQAKPESMQSQPTKKK